MNYTEFRLKQSAKEVMDVVDTTNEQISKWLEKEKMKDIREILVDVSFHPILSSQYRPHFENIRIYKYEEVEPISLSDEQLESFPKAWQTDRSLYLYPVDQSDVVIYRISTVDGLMGEFNIELFKVKFQQILQKWNVYDKVKRIEMWGHWWQIKHDDVECHIGNIKLFDAEGNQITQIQALIDYYQDHYQKEWYINEDGSFNWEEWIDQGDINDYFYDHDLSFYDFYAIFDETFTLENGIVVEVTE